MIFDLLQALFNLTTCYIMFSLVKSNKKLRREWALFKEQRKKLYASLADPLEIERQMEAGARLREMHDANRTTLPREDSGPPARIWRPNLRGQKPGTWRPRNPGSPSKQ